MPLHPARTTITRHAANNRQAQTINRHRVNMWCELLLAILDNRPVTLLPRGATRAVTTHQPTGPQLRLL